MSDKTHVMLNELIELLRARGADSGAVREPWRLLQRVLFECEFEIAY